MNPGLLTQRTELWDIFTRYVALLWISSFGSGIQSAATRGEGREGGWWGGTLQVLGGGGGGSGASPLVLQHMGEILNRGDPPPFRPHLLFPGIRVRHPPSQNILQRPCSLPFPVWPGDTLARPSAMGLQPPSGKTCCKAGEARPNHALNWRKLSRRRRQCCQHHVCGERWLNRHWISPF